MEKEQNKKWVPLLEYAVSKGISVSTLRRRIKAKQIEFQLQKGRYYLLDDGSFPLEETHKVISDLREEVADLKTLVQVLEAKINR